MTTSDYLNNFFLGYLPYIALGVFAAGFIYRAYWHYHTCPAPVYKYTCTGNRSIAGLYHRSPIILPDRTGFVGHIHYHSISTRGLYGYGTLGTRYCYIRTRFVEIYSPSELGIQTAYY